MKFTNEWAVAFKKDIKLLFERLNHLNGAIDIKLEELAREAKEKDSEKDQKGKLTESKLKEIIIESCSLEESAISQSVLDDDLAKQSEGFLDFDSFFHDPKITKQKSVNCFCSTGEIANIADDDQFTMSSLTFTCYRTKKEGTTFFISNLEEDKGNDNSDYMNIYLSKIANGCSMHHTPISPDSGDCALHLLANIVCRSSFIVKNQNKLRKLMDLPLLFGDNASSIRESFKDLDCTFILRQLVSQFLKYDDNSISDLTIKEPFQKELICIYEKTSTNKMSFLGADGNKKKKKKEEEE